MRAGREEHKAPQSESAPALDTRAFEGLSLRAQDPFSRLVLHYGVKALGHAVLAADALDGIESGKPAAAQTAKRFHIEENPLSFSLAGLTGRGIIVPTTALISSRVFWPHLFPTPDRVGFAHPDFINPLTAAAGLHPTSVPLGFPGAFFQLPWSKADLADRDKMGAALVFGQRLWESSRELFTRRAGTDPSVGAVEKLIDHYQSTLTKLTAGAPRHESLARGERFIADLFRRDEEVAAAALKRAHRALDEAPAAPPSSARRPHPLEAASLDELLPAKPRTTAKPRAASSKPAPSKLTSQQSYQDAEDLKKLDALEKLVGSADVDERTEAMTFLKRWQGSFSPRIKSELARILNVARQTERGFEKLEQALTTFERGDTEGGAKIARRVAENSRVPVVVEAARDLLHRFKSALSDRSLTETPADAWPQPLGKRPIIDVLRAAYERGSDAEVFRRNGQRCSGRLCVSGDNPTALRLFDFAHEITWTIDLSDIARVNLFYDDPPPRAPRKDRPAERKDPPTGQ